MGSQRDTAHWWGRPRSVALSRSTVDLRLPLESLYHEVKRRAGPS